MRAAHVGPVSPLRLAVLQLGESVSPGTGTRGQQESISCPPSPCKKRLAPSLLDLKGNHILVTTIRKENLPTPCSVVTYMGRKSKKEWIYIYV